jgi:hypothetical protein
MWLAEPPAYCLQCSVSIPVLSMNKKVEEYEVYELYIERTTDIPLLVNYIARTTDISLVGELHF